MARPVKSIAKLDGSTLMNVKLDELDRKIIVSLMSGQSNKEISKSLRVPLSTIQRRSRHVLEKNLILERMEPNFRLLGYSKGLLHLYVRGRDVTEVAKQLASLKGMTRVSLHIGNSDVVGEIIYRNSSEIMEIIARAKKIEGVDRVIWSEEVYEVPVANPGGKVPSYLAVELSGRHD